MFTVAYKCYTTAALYVPAFRPAYGGMQVPDLTYHFVFVLFADTVNLLKESISHNIFRTFLCFSSMPSIFHRTNSFLLFWVEGVTELD